MRNNKRTIKGKKLSAKDLQYQISRLFMRQRSNKYNAKQIIRKLKIANSKDSVSHALKTLEQKGLISHHKEGKYRYNNRAPLEVQASSSPTKTYTGSVDLTKSGDGYVLVDGLDDDVFIRRRNLKGALDKDVVKIAVPQIKGKRRPEGRVIDILERATSHIIGRLYHRGKLGVVQSLDKSFDQEVYIHAKHLNDADHGSPVVVKITEWGQGQNKSLWGKVTEVMQDASENDLAMQSILLSNGFDLDFPPAVKNQLKDIQPGVVESEVARRRDMRAVPTITIDPLTARDFDDALSYEELPDGNIEVGVHIADVTHYVPEDSPLDKEALNRSTSVYLVDRVLPMLPEKLSNDLCSLNPHEDRYTFSAVFTFDKKYKIVNKWFGRSVIHSDRRFTYEEAQEVIETGKGDYAKEILALNKIAKKLRKEKYKNGAISFESDEVQFILDDNGKPINTYVKQRKEAHMLVEDFMLLANRAVAEYIFKLAKPEIPFIYRIHDEPNPDKLNDFALFARSLGVKMKIDTPEQIAASFNAMTKMAQEDDRIKLLLPLGVRTMSKAEYSTNNIGHYGLAFDFYTHFTSPIRRYSDVLVHRYLDKNLNGNIHRTDKEKLEAKAKHISMQERKATDAERESVKYKQTEYLLDQIGKEFNGVVSGMIDRGIFVELVDSKAEGLISFDKLKEPYTVAENRLKAVGRKTGHEIYMGKKVVVKILDADLEKKQIEMKVVEWPEMDLKK